MSAVVGSAKSGNVVAEPATDIGGKVMEIFTGAVSAIRNVWRRNRAMRGTRRAATGHVDRRFRASSVVLCASLATLALPGAAWAGYGAVVQGYYNGCGHPRSVHFFTYNQPSQAIADREALALCTGHGDSGCHISSRFGKGRCMYFSASAGITECYHGYAIAYGSTAGEAAARCDAARARYNSAPTCSVPQGGCNQ